MTEPCPSAERLSAWLDGELPPAEATALAGHAAACPACAAALSDLRGLRTAFEQLPQPTLGVDLAGVIEGRLAARPRLRPASRGPSAWWRLVPASLGAAGALSLGLALGSALAPGAVAARVPLMAVFDPVPPGALCIGMNSCYAKDSLQ